MRSDNLLFIVLREIGLLLPVVGGMAICSIPVSLYFGEYFALVALPGYGWSFLFIGCPFLSSFSSYRTELSVRKSMLVAAGGWLLLSVVGSLPFLFISLNLFGNPEVPATVLNFLNPLNAFFESIPGLRVPA